MLLSPDLLSRQISADTSATRKLAHHHYQRFPVQQHAALGYRANARWSRIAAASHQAPVHHMLHYESRVVSCELWSLELLPAVRDWKFEMCLQNHSSYSTF